MKACVVFTMLSLAGCSMTTGCSSETLNVTEVLNHSQCKTLPVGLSRVAIEDLPGIRGARLLTPPDLATQNTEASGDSTHATTAPVWLFAVSNGPQSTPGYGFELHDVLAHAGQVKLNYAWLTPPADAVLAQVVTTPCSIVQLDPNDKVQTVSAWLDDNEIGRVELTPATRVPPPHVN